MFYLAGPDEERQRVLAELMQTFSIKPMVVANGFERLFPEEAIVSRTGHDWDQLIQSRTTSGLDDPRLEAYYGAMGKQVVIVTTIGFSMFRCCYRTRVVEF